MRTTEEYLGNLIELPFPWLEEVAREAEARGIPALGKVCGYFLWQAVRLTAGQRALELGSGIGYSAVWIAAGLQEGAEILLTDYAEENLKLAEQFVRRARPDLRVTTHAGEAMDLLRQQEPHSLDVLFVDIQKERYPEVLTLARTRLRPGGLLAADNWLWGRRILDPANREPSTQGIREFNAQVLRDHGFVSFFLPLRDGLVLAFRREQA